MNPTDWHQLLDNLSASISKSFDEVERHEQSLASPLLADDPPTANHASWQQALEQVGRRLEEFRQHVARTEIDTTDAEGVLAGLTADTAEYREQVRRMAAQISTDITPDTLNASP